MERPDRARAAPWLSLVLACAWSLKVSLGVLLPAYAARGSNLPLPTKLALRVAAWTWSPASWAAGLVVAFSILIVVQLSQPRDARRALRAMGLAALTWSAPGHVALWLPATGLPAALALVTVVPIALAAGALAVAAWIGLALDLPRVPWTLGWGGAAATARSAGPSEKPRSSVVAPWRPGPRRQPRFLCQGARAASARRLGATAKGDSRSGG
ncbi:MAG: hypothetical protein AB7N76_02210 [Planctomycetota bacterium]